MAVNELITGLLNARCMPRLPGQHGYQWTVVALWLTPTIRGLSLNVAAISDGGEPKVAEFDQWEWMPDNWDAIPTVTPDEVVVPLQSDDDAEQAAKEFDELRTRAVDPEMLARLRGKIGLVRKRRPPPVPQK